MPPKAVLAVAMLLAVVIVTATQSIEELAPYIATSACLYNWIVYRLRYQDEEQKKMVERTLYIYTTLCEMVSHTPKFASSKYRPIKISPYLTTILWRAICTKRLAARNPEALCMKALYTQALYMEALRTEALYDALHDTLHDALHNALH